MVGSNLFALGIITLLSLIVVVIIWQIGGNVKARASAAREEAYRKLAAQATEALQSSNEEQRKIAQGVADIQERVAAVEKILREVE